MEVRETAMNVLVDRFVQTFNTTPAPSEPDARENTYIGQRTVATPTM